MTDKKYEPYLTKRDARILYNFVIEGMGSSLRRLAIDLSIRNPSPRVLDGLRQDLSYLTAKGLIMRMVHESSIPGSNESFFITKKGLKLVKELKKKRKLEKLVA